VAAFADAAGVAVAEEGIAVAERMDSEASVATVEKMGLAFLLRLVGD